MRMSNEEALLEMEENIDKEIERLQLTIQFSLFINPRIVDKYCLMNNLEYTFKKLGGIIYREYFLEIRNAPAWKVLPLLKQIDKISKE